MIKAATALPFILFVSSAQASEEPRNLRVVGLPLAASTFVNTLTTRTTLTRFPFLAVHQVNTVAVGRDVANGHRELTFWWKTGCWWRCAPAKPACVPIHCPANSFPNAEADGCVDSDHECICNSGFVKVNGKCFRWW